ncbi:MAG TPA: bifunctional nicotinamidase/pyrazinamidase [Puia sp.]|uniref:bifunctional nicotinamidase/pyrazinamidase n=1 Tax=Puia sp. TaxID=2045100 RepID=UPI002C0D3E4C|nr:bifunctional nicotinamidase/pyrazinamidase [Puia sp.]HVU97089.1 bifunctional nicotinamidase/pyrazinamidase [Puia sp.]
MNALILVDIQNDFLKGGPLAVPDADAIVPLVNHLQDHFDLVVATQDWHPSGHRSFASGHPGKKPFEVVNLNGLPQTLWPDHCVQGTRGAGFPARLNMNKPEAIFRKGANPEIDSYSGFYDNGHRKSTGLAGYLRDRSVDTIYLAGLAGDICVYYTALDSLKAAFSTFIIEDATRPLNRENFEKVMLDFQARGGKLIQSGALAGIT